MAESVEEVLRLEVEAAEGEALHVPRRLHRRPRRTEALSRRAACRGPVGRRARVAPVAVLLRLVVAPPEVGGRDVDVAGLLERASVLQLRQAHAHREQVAALAKLLRCQRHQA